jgi:hypothetical protein
MKERGMEGHWDMFGSVPWEGGGITVPEKRSEVMGQSPL